MDLSKILEPSKEGEWISFETEEGAKIEGKLETTSRKYTDEQRKEIFQNAQYFGRKDKKRFSEQRALEPPENSYIPNLEPNGELVTAKLTNEFDNYTVEITKFDDSTHLTLETDEGHQRDFALQNVSVELYEEAITQYNQEMDIQYIEKIEQTETRPKTVLKSKK